MTTTHRAIVVESVHVSGVDISVDGAVHRISWQTLDDACSQSDAELASEYQVLRDEAMRMASCGPVIVEVCQDDSNVWWVCRVYAAYGSGPVNYHRLRDEGGTLPDLRSALREADAIVRRLCARVYRTVGC